MLLGDWVAVLSPVTRGWHSRAALAIRHTVTAQLSAHKREGRLRPSPTPRETRCRRRSTPGSTSPSPPHCAQRGRQWRYGPAIWHAGTQPGWTPGAYGSGRRPAPARDEPQGREACLSHRGEGGGVGSVVEEGPAGRAGPGRRRRCPQAAPHAPAPAPPALSPKDTRNSAQSRASNQFSNN